MNFKSIFAMAFMATALVGTTFSFVACEDDEKEEVVLGSQEDGTYIATADITVGAGKQVMKLATVKSQNVIVATPKSYSPLISISGYEADLPAGAPYSHISQERYQLTNVKSTKLEDGTIQLSGEEEVTMKLRMVMPGKTLATTPYTEYKTKVKTQGTLKNGKLNLTNTFRPGNKPMDIVYTYTGQR